MKPRPAPPNNPIASSSSNVPSTPAQQVTQTPAPPAAPGPASGPPMNVPSTPSPAARAVVGNTTDDAHFNDPSALALGAAQAAAVANMESMGFPRADIDRAMRAAFFNPDRAVEYLLNVSYPILHQINLCVTNWFKRVFPRTFNRNSLEAVRLGIAPRPLLPRRQQQLGTHPPRQNLLPILATNRSIYLRLLPKPFAVPAAQVVPRARHLQLPPVFCKRV